MSVSRLPGGRGPRISDDAIVGQEEIYQQRGNFRPQELIYYYTTMGTPNTPTDIGIFPTTYPINTMFLVPLPQPLGDFTPVMSSINITPGSPPAPIHRVEYALYRYVEGSPDQFIQIPQSRQLVQYEGSPGDPDGKYAVATSDITGGGMAFNFSGNGEAAWLGYQVLDATTDLFGTHIENGVLPYYVQPIAVGGSLPLRIARATIPRSQSNTYFVPAISFKTKRGARMFGEF